MNEDIKESFKQTLNLSFAIFLILFFVIVEINLNDNLVSLIPVLVVASVVLMVFIVTVHKEYESYTGLTFVIFGFIIALIDIINIVNKLRFNFLFISEIVVGIMIVIYGKSLFKNLKLNR
ncbi:hypothetical protein J4214_05610 [Candidatus Woesearchaeota archaeon]|nr:hypothetical protein [Candidatus Woesearchaeota archaeon]